ILLFLFRFLILHQLFCSEFSLCRILLFQTGQGVSLFQAFPLNPQAASHMAQTALPSSPISSGCTDLLMPSAHKTDCWTEAYADSGVRYPCRQVLRLCAGGQSASKTAVSCEGCG